MQIINVHLQMVVKFLQQKQYKCYDYIKAIKASYSCTQWCKLINHPFWASNMQPFQ